MRLKLQAVLLLSLMGVVSNTYATAAAPLQAAIDACADKGEGDACDFVSSAGEDLDGFCRYKNPNDPGKLVCVIPQQ